MILYNLHKAQKLINSITISYYSYRIIKKAAFVQYGESFRIILTFPKITWYNSLIKARKKGGLSYDDTVDSYLCTISHRSRRCTLHDQRSDKVIIFCGECCVYYIRRCNCYSLSGISIRMFPTCTKSYACRNCSVYFPISSGGKSVKSSSPSPHRKNVPLMTP